MTAFHTSLSRLVSSLRSADVMAQTIEAETEERQEQQAAARAARLLGFAAARAEAAGDAERAARLRAAYGLPSTAVDAIAGPAVRRDLPTSVEPAVSVLRRRRRDLDRAEAEFKAWRERYDALSKRLVVALCGLVAVLGLTVMTAVSGEPALSATTLVLIGVSALAAVTSATTLAVARQLPDIEAVDGGRGVLAIARFAGRLAVPTAAGLAVLRLVLEVVT